VDQATVDRLRAHDWGSDPFEATPTAGDPYRIRLVAGRCFFLDRENRCRIHTELSYEEKPAVCRAFPLAVLEVAGKQYARMSFWCPTVTANTGKPLELQSRWLKNTAAHGDHREAPLMINEKTEIGVRDFERVHKILRHFLVTSSSPMAQRLAAAGALVRRLDEASRRDQAFSAERIVTAAESDGLVQLAAETRRLGNPAGGRRALALYLLQDWRGGHLAILGRFVSVLLFSAGLTPLKSRAVPAKASWRQVKRVAFELSPVSDALLTRYLCSKLDSRRYVAGDATLITGFNLLVAAYGMIDVMARMRAASAGRLSCDDDDVRMAVSAADLLVVEHPGLYQGRFQRQLTQSALGSADFCGDLLARLEGSKTGRLD
jgi:Fe-S-cluster containining protein